jgi:hypothetical protein
MLEQNTELTAASKLMAERIENLTVELHNHILASSQESERYGLAAYEASDFERGAVSNPDGLAGHVFA